MTYTTKLTFKNSRQLVVNIHHDQLLPHNNGTWILVSMCIPVWLFSPDKTKDHAVTEFDGYNSYLLVVDESTKYTWVYLCELKEPLLHLIDLHLDQIGGKSGFIHTNQAGKVAGSHKLITCMAACKFMWNPQELTVPTGINKLNVSMKHSESLLEYYTMVQACLPFSGPLPWFTQYISRTAECT